MRNKKVKLLYIQKDVDSEFVNSYRSKYKGSSYIEVPNIRLDFYPETNKMFVSSYKNELFLEITVDDDLVKSGYKIEKVRLLDEWVYMFLSKKSSKTSINIKTLKYDKHNGCINKVELPFTI